MLKINAMIASGVIALNVFGYGSQVLAASPWDEPSDPAAAINHSDEYAWRLFIALNWPTASGSCDPDGTKKFGDPGAAVWEKWPDKFQTYLRNGSDPGNFNKNCSTVIAAKDFAPTGQADVLPSRGSGVRPAFAQPGDGVSVARDEEVRINKKAYEFIRTEGLYSRNEQIARATLAIDARLSGKPVPEKGIIKFPIEAKEVKGHWAIIREEDKPRYHWAMGKYAGKDVIYGLVGWSVTTKDLPNWFWATFEHVDNETAWPQLKKDWPDNIKAVPAEVAKLNKLTAESFAGWVVKSVDRFACKGKQPDCNEFPKGLGIENTKWQFYRLRGTQTEFVDSVGMPTQLVNSKIEGSFEQNHMSCITCHALAATNQFGNAMPIFILQQVGDTREKNIGYIGVPRMSLNDLMQLDFVWSLRRASCNASDPRPCQ